MFPPSERVVTVKSRDGVATLEDVPLHVEDGEATYRITGGSVRRVRK